MKSAAHPQPFSCVVERGCRRPQPDEARAPFQITAAS